MSVRSFPGAWQPVEVCAEEPLDCTVCGETVAQGHLYGVNAYGRIAEVDERARAFDAAFEMDALADFRLCESCYEEYGGPDGPMGWLRRYLEEDRQIISREEAIRLLS